MQGSAMREREGVNGATEKIPPPPSLLHKGPYQFSLLSHKDKDASVDEDDYNIADNLPQFARK